MTLNVLLALCFAGQVSVAQLDDGRMELFISPWAYIRGNLENGIFVFNEDFGQDSREVLSQLEAVGVSVSFRELG